MTKANNIIQFPVLINPRVEARMYYYGGWSISDISQKMAVPRSTLTFWRDSENWDKSSPYERCQATAEIKFQYLVAKENKSNNDYKELDALGRLLDKLFFPKPDVVKNKRSAQINKADFDFDKFKLQINEALADLYPFQRTVMQQIEHASKQPNSGSEALILKTRQAGMTRTLAHSRFARAINTGNSQAFISASKNQAYQLRSYITKFVHNVTGINLKGRDLVKVGQNIQLNFLGCNVSTAQGYSADVTVDEFMWMPNFTALKDAVSACATLDQYNVIYSSSASSKKHESYGFWSAHDWNKNRKNKNQKVKVDHDTLKEGLLCHDGKFRKIITLHDALEGGLLNVTESKLRIKYPDEKSFNQLFMCEFMDEKGSAFNFDHLIACMVDMLEEWTDYKPFERPNRPLLDAPVAIGFDPARTNDGSVCTALAVPTKQGEKFRALEKIIMHGIDFDQQTQVVKDLCDRYNVVHIGIDAKGLGMPIAERIAKFFPNITRYNGDPELKNIFVLLAQDMFSKREFQFDRGWIDFVTSFMAIKKVMTKSGNKMTYQSDRTEENSHSDLAWSTMYAMGVKGIDGQANFIKRDYVSTF